MHAPVPFAFAFSPLCFHFAFLVFVGDKPRPDLLPSSGWGWALPPSKNEIGAKSWIIVEQEGETVRKWAQVGNMGIAAVRKAEGWTYRVVLVGKDGERLRTFHAISDNGIAGVAVYSAEDIPEYAGVEVLTPEKMKGVADEAFQAAKSKGLAVLPFAGIPELRDSWPNKYAFVLKSADGATIDSSRMVGKAIVVDCWATWCGPCMELLPELSKLWKRHSTEIEIVSICYDSPESKQAQETINKFEMKKNWRLLFAPKANDERRLWEISLSAKESVELPRVYIVDSKGRLVHSTPRDLGRDLDRILREGTKR